MVRGKPKRRKTRENCADCGGFIEQTVVRMGGQRVAMRKHYSDKPTPHGWTGWKVLKPGQRA